jgi:hypothetical protein
MSADGYLQNLKLAKVSEHIRCSTWIEANKANLGDIFSSASLERYLIKKGLLYNGPQRAKRMNNLDNGHKSETKRKYFKKPNRSNSIEECAQSCSAEVGHKLQPNNLSPLSGPADYLIYPEISSYCDKLYIDYDFYHGMDYSLPSFPSFQREPMKKLGFL